MPETVAGATPYGNWNQALGTLGASLFPDPSKIAQAGYYGAEQRRAALQGNEAIRKGNMANYALTQAPDSGLPPATLAFSTPPGSPPGAPPVPVPQGLPMQGTPPPSAPPSLSTTVTTPPAQGQGMPMPPPSISPEQIANLATPGTTPNPQGAGTTGTPPAASSPAPNSGAPPAPNTTGSDGSVPPSADALSAVIHPGTFQAPGGGIKYAPPAQADGSPAVNAFNPALYAQTLVQAGYDAASVNSASAAYVMQFVRKGIIDQHTANPWLAAFGATGPLTAETNITTTAMQNRTDLAKQSMVTGEQRYEFQQGPVMVTDQPGGAPRFVPRVNAPGQLAYDAPYSTQYNTPTLVQPSGPAAPPVYMKAGAIPPGTPGYNAQFSTNYTTPQTVGGPQGQACDHPGRRTAGRRRSGLLGRAGESPPRHDAGVRQERQLDHRLAGGLRQRRLHAGATQPGHPGGRSERYPKRRR